MTLLRRLAPHAWIVVLLGAVLVSLWFHVSQAARVDHVTGLLGTSIARDPASPTGYAGGLRLLVTPGHNDESCQWIIQTQQMLAGGSWRIRHVTYDNAPDGRAVESPSPYRWWLALVAGGNRLLTGANRGISVERAALWADPALHLLGLVGCVVFTARRFGQTAAIALAVAMACAFPFTGMFVAGAPEDVGLTQLTLLASLLVLLAGAVSPRPSARCWYAASGVLMGLALWLNPGAAVPIVASIAVGGVLAVCHSPRTDGSAQYPGPVPWRWWGLAGGATTITAWLVEFAPGHLSWTAPGLVEVHPIYGIAWIGLAETVHRLASRLQGGGYARGRAGWSVAALALGATAALPLEMLRGSSRAFLTPENFATRLTGLGDGIAADDLFTWLARDGRTLAFWAAVLPLILVLPALWRLARGHRAAAGAAATTLLLMPALVAAGFTGAQLGWWAHMGTTLLVLLVALTARIGPAPAPLSRRAGIAAVGIAAALPGAWTVHAMTARTDDDLSPLELRSLVERDIAHWLARRNAGEGGTIIAPPDLTTSLIFHGGLPGLGSTYRENSTGFAAAVRLCGASSADEAQALAERRGVTQFVMPSWDLFLDEYAALGASRFEDSLVGMLRAWLPPLWLEPVAYYLPPLPQYAGEQVIVFEVTELQDVALSWSRMAEYFLDMGDIALAAEMGHAIAGRHGDDLGGLIAIARIQIARQDRAGLERTLGTLVARVEEGEDDVLPWDRRVSLSLVLAVGQRMDLARLQVESCIELAGEREWRRLATPALVHITRLIGHLGLEVQDANLRQLIEQRLPSSSG